MKYLIVIYGQANNPEPFEPKYVFIESRLVIQKIDNLIDDEFLFAVFEIGDCVMDRS